MGSRLVTPDAQVIYVAPLGGGVSRTLLCTSKMMGNGVWPVKGLFERRRSWRRSDVVDDVPPQGSHALCSMEVDADRRLLEHESGLTQ